jgi:hypothetical protein
MATIILDLVSFRQRFPEFSVVADYPDTVIQMYWDMATCYISDEDYGCLSGSCRELAIQQMTAHLTKIGKAAETGDFSDFVTSAGVDKVSVSVQPPPQKNQYSWWLNTTPYGAQYEALLKSKSIGGCYIGGAPERSAFRNLGGYFYG